MPSPPSEKPRIDDALRLRWWALRTLSSETKVLLPECSEATWKLFLQTERCGLPLKRCLVRQGLWQGMYPEARGVLDAFATREMQEVLAARAGLGEIARLANDLSMNIVVLKGGVAAVCETHAVPLWDIDVLLWPRDSEVFAAALDRCGYTDLGGGSEKHLGPRFTPEKLPIEVHTALDPHDELWTKSAWERAIPLTDLPALQRLSPRDHLWLLLKHVVVQHPYRAGSIRDLLLIADALAECSREELADLATHNDRGSEARVFKEVLALARQLRSGDGLEDPFRGLATTTYLLQLRGNQIPGPEILKADIASSVFFLQRGLGAYWRWCCLVIWRRTGTPSRSPPIAWIETRARAVGRFVRVASRVIRLAAAVLPALVLTAIAARHVARSKEIVYDKTESSS